MTKIRPVPSIATEISESAASRNGREVSTPLRTPTFGVMLGDSPVEAVMDPTKGEALGLHIRKGTRFSTLPQIEYGGKIYVPAALNVGLVRAVRFPSPSAHYGSDEKLARSASDFIFNFVKTTREEADLLASFALSTWFVDCFRRAPSLHLSGPSGRVHSLMRLLTCLCRAPFYLDA